MNKLEMMIAIIQMIEESSLELGTEVQVNVLDGEIIVQWRGPGTSKTFTIKIEEK